VLIAKERPRVSLVGIPGFLARSLEMGSAVVLTGLLLFLIVGGFSIWNTFSPFKLTSLDPTSLRAEAQAIDIQIRLTDIAYADPIPFERTTTPPLALPLGKIIEITKQVERDGELAEPSATSTPRELTIDEALEELSR
jgi:hypothetical protein